MTLDLKLLLINLLTGVTRGTAVYLIDGHLSLLLPSVSFHFLLLVQYSFPCSCMLLSILNIFAMVIPSSVFKTIGHNTIFTLKQSNYQIRPFDSSQDQLVLEEICKDVWNGTDYLPSMARKFADDESCDFVVMQNEDGNVVALGNRRYEILEKDDEENTIQKISWIEAIRINKQYMGKGLATALIKAFIHRSKQDGITHILSSTVEDNLAMKKVFDRVDMKITNKMYRLDFAALKELPGWGASSSDSQRTVESLLKALKIEHLVKKSSRSVQWSTVKCEAELNLALKKIKNSGGIGHLPGLGKPYFYNENFRESLRKGLIRKFENEANDSTALYGLIEDSSIQSLKSKWVCSIAGLDCLAFEAALWDACSDNMVAKRGGEAAFALVYDGGLIDPTSSVMNALPIQTNSPFIIYSNIVTHQPS